MKTMIMMASVAVLGFAMSATSFAGSTCCPTQTKPAATTQPVAKACACAKDSACKAKCETCKCEKDKAQAKS